MVRIYSMMSEVKSEFDSDLNAGLIYDYGKNIDILDDFKAAYDKFVTANSATRPENAEDVRTAKEAFADALMPLFSLNEDNRGDLANPPKIHINPRISSLEKPAMTIQGI